MNNIKIYAEVLEEEALKQFKNAMALDCNVQGALMPDAHTGYTLPIGAVVKSKGKVFPAYVGYDIGCGMCAVKLDTTKEEIDLEKLKEHILKTIPIGFKKHNEPQHSKPNFKTYNTSFLLERWKLKGVYQVGTLGGGNHFIEIGEGENDKKLWIVIHSGSRGFGHNIAEHYMKLASINNVDASHIEAEFLRGREVFKEKNPRGFLMAQVKYLETYIEKHSKNKEGHYGLGIDSEVGKQYIADMEFCLDFALENRKAMIARIYEGIFEQKVCKIEEFINRNHNHAELKDGFVIHRKGATHAEKDMMGVIPGNMRDGSFIVKGKGNQESMCSSSHGAGRVLSRSQARKTLDADEFKKETELLVTNHTEDMLDESPKAYKNIFEVMELQKELVDIVDRVIPILNIKG